MTLETLLDVCPEDISVGYWIQATHLLLRWLERSPLDYMILGGVMLFGFIIVSGLLMRGFILWGRGRSIRRLWIWGFPVALVVSLSPMVIGEPLLTQFLPVYDGQTADAVVVLGRGMYLRTGRVARAAELIATGRAPRVFVSGRGDAVPMAAMLTELGIDSSKVAGENCSATTEQNATYTAQQLLPTGVQSIILVSDPHHLLRSQLVFRSRGFEVIPYSSPLPDNVSRRYRRLLAMRESLGLVTYGLMGRYLPRPMADVNATAVQ